MLDIKKWSLVNLAEVTDIIVSNVDKKTIINEKSVKLCNYFDMWLSLSYCTPKILKNLWYISC
ncbi:hypothetical protein A1I_05725 [Rickettsia bellii OSU 85-389]|uniref:hypothetical protein n=1 Tax=Rickettsia bellii TaxID=33990 RepID=UPI0000DB0FD7|nr:hypothetical protein [Rickettsia bellii]ABV79469.1 hypothetical protein A1I_05725 [Rickettsia bellii OSU 85-389]